MDTTVRFDDRLATLLTLPVAGSRDRAVRWRQLVELAARASEARAEGSAPMVAALAVIRSEREAVPIEIRSATARAIAGRELGEQMLMLFAEEDLAVAAPIFAGTRLKKPLRARLLTQAAGNLRQFLSSLWPDLREQDVAGAQLGEIVERLKAARRDIGDEGGREAAAVERKPVEKDSEERERERPNETPQIVQASDEPRVAERPVEARATPSAFSWEAGPDGTIDWVEGAPRAALVGRRLDADETIASKIDAHEALERVETRFAGLPGSWLLDASPQHDPDDGRFLGYRGRARRTDATVSDEEPLSAPEPASAPSAQMPPAEEGRDAQSLRELVHEIKTPLNAIIGFAEIIDGQYLGPAHRRYRERAAEIVTQARILLEAIKDLDVAARLQADGDRAPADLSAIVRDLMPSLATRAARAGAALRFDGEGEGPRCASGQELAERLIDRLVGALLPAARIRETLTLDVAGDEQCHLAVTIPASLRALDERRLFDPSHSLEQDGKPMLGLGFSLRLVRGLARVSGGDLRVEKEALILSLPRA